MPKSGWGQESSVGGGNADPNVMKIEEQNRIRLLDDGKVDWYQHTVEHASDPERVKFVVCARTHPCPLCAKLTDPKGNERFPKSQRFATNVFDYSTGTVKVLIAGRQVFGEKGGFFSFVKMQFDPLASDFIIHRTGKGRNTAYTLARGDTEAFQHQVSPDQLHDLSKYDAEPSEQAAIETLEEMGYDYDSLGILEYSLEDALAHVVPFKKFSGMTVEQVMATEPDYIKFMVGFLEGKGQTGDANYIAFHKVLSEYGMLDGEPTAEAKAPPATPPTEVPPNTEAQPVQVTPVADASSSSASMVAMVGADGNEVAVPPTAVEGMEASGFTVKGAEVPVPEPETVTLLNGDQKVTVDPATAVALEAAGWARELPAPGTTEPATEDDKPFKCDQCDWAGKTSGSLTQHTKRDHTTTSNVTPAPAQQAPPAATNGAVPTGAPVIERVKTKLASVSANDYDSMLSLFEEISGKRSLTEFTEEQLAILEQKLDAGALAS